MAVERYMSWEGGVDLASSTDPQAAQPNVILHVARMVHTPVGSAPSGLIFFQPDPAAPPAVWGFVSADAAVGAYFGPHIFAGTPFESAPVLEATIEITEELPGAVKARITTGEWVFETRLSQLSALEAVNRPVQALPFLQQGLEAAAGATEVVVNGEAVTVYVPETGMSGGPGAVWAPCGLYAR